MIGDPKQDPEKTIQTVLPLGRATALSKLPLFLTAMYTMKLKPTANRLSRAVLALLAIVSLLLSRPFQAVGQTQSEKGAAVLAQVSPLTQEPNQSALAARRAFEDAEKLVAEGSTTSRRMALEKYEQALRLVRALAERQAEAIALHRIATVYDSLNEKQRALEYFGQALQIVKAIVDRGGEAATLNGIGLVYYSLGEKQKALDYFNQALPIMRALGDLQNEAAVLANIGEVYTNLGENQTALGYYSQALPIFRRVSDRSGEATTLRMIGFVYDSLGEWQRALEYYNQALTILRALGDRSGEGTTLNNIGHVYDSLGEGQKALEYFNQALPILRAVGNRQGEAKTLNNIGLAYVLLGEKQKALEYYEQALPILRAVGDRRGEAATLNNVGLAYDSLGEKQKALEYYKQALPILTAVGDRSGEAKTLNNMGFVYDSLGEWQKALGNYNQALPILRALGDRRVEATTLHNVGLVYFSLGEWSKALEYYNQALPILRAVGDRRVEASTLGSIGNVYYSLGEERKALEYQNQALQIMKAVGDRSGEAAMLTGIGVTHLALAERTALAERQKTLEYFNQALEYFNQALPILRVLGNRQVEATTLNNIGLAYGLLGEKHKAGEHHQRALQILRAVGDRSGEATTLDNLSFLWKTSNRRLAIFFGKQAVNALQQLRSNIGGLEKGVQKTFLRSKADAYRQLAGILIAEGRLPEAHQVLNLFKDQQFFDFNRDSQQPARPLTLTPHEALIAQRYEQTSKRLELAGRQLDELKRNIGTLQANASEAAQLRQLEWLLRTASDQFLAVLTQAEAEFNEPPSAKDKVGEVANTRELQAALRQLSQQTGQNAVAVYTLVGADDFRALLITANNITAVSQPVKGDALNEKALQFWALLQSDSYDPTELSQELYATVFKPIEGQLAKEITTILWSLDSNLRYLPMSALHDGRQYLIERYNHVVFTRADSERLLRDVSPHWTGLGLGSSQAHTVELLGDRISFRPLPGVTEELRALFRREGLPGGVLEGEVLPDAKFTKTAMLNELKRKRPLVHISSHFSFRPGDDTRSFLLLGDGSAMTLAEMKAQSDLFAGVELLTLSACNTAAQQAGADGREIDGFAELAQRLGAGSVMATLWPVADNSTPWLMREFYETRQAANGMTKAEALRWAQLALLSGEAKTKPLPEGQKGSPTFVHLVVVPNERRRDGGERRSDLVYVDEKDAPEFRRNESRPFAHPYYWAPFILIGNWR